MIFDAQNIVWHDVCNVEAGYERLAGLIEDARAGGGPTATVLVPSVLASSIYKEELAARGVVFGVRVEDFYVWLRDMWELFGDGRRMVDPATRSILCALALDANPQLRATPGMIGLLSGMVEECLPHLLSQDALTAENLSQNERAFLECAVAYAHMLVERGLVEMCDAACLVAPNLAGDLVFLAGFDEDDLTPAHTSALGATGANVIRNARTKAPATPRNSELARLLESISPEPSRGSVDPTGAVRFAIASGVTAETRLLVDELKRIAQNGDVSEVVVVSPNSEKAFYAASADLIDAGFDTALRCSKRLSQSTVGRLITRVGSAFSSDSPFDKKAATELLMSDIVGTMYAKAFRFDTAARNDRLIGADKLHADLDCYLKQTWIEIVDLLSEGRLKDSLDDMRAAIMRESRLPEGYRVEQLAAIQAMHELAALAEKERAPYALVVDAVKEREYRVELDCYAATPGPRAVFMSLEDAASLRPSSCDVLVLTCMTSEDYPVRDRTTSRHTLLEKTGVKVPREPLKKARRVFYDALASAASAVVLERSLHNADADPSYPAAVYDEVIECYRTPGEKPCERAKKFGLCNSLVEAECVSPLEESRFVYAITGLDQQPVSFKEPTPETGVLSKDVLGYVLPPRKTGGCEGEKVIPATDIEMYLQCPYKWFLERRLKPDVPDEELGSREYGTFVHTALERFYTDLKDDGHARVTGDNLERAREVLQTSFDQVVEEQYELEPKPKSCRFVPAAAFEYERFTTCRHALTKYVEREARFLPGFKPVHLEHAFGSEKPVEYAGVLVSGKIDRIDIDDQGRAVVIDYKSGSVKDADISGLGFAEDGSMALPFKTQAFIYAQVARHELGLNVVGVAYVSPVKREVCAVFDSGVLSCGDFLADAKNCIPLPNREAQGDVEGFRSFAHALDCIEEEIAQRIPALVDGETKPDPSEKAACAYCGAALCDERLGKE